MPATTAKKKPEDLTPSQHVDRMISDTGDWRGDILAKLRKLLLGADAGARRGVEVDGHADILQERPYLRHESAQR